MGIVFVLVGVALVLLMQYDVVATVLHPDVEGPVSSLFQRGIWTILRRIAVRMPRRRVSWAVMNWGLPLLVAGLIALWMVLLMLGFALIYYPWIRDPSSFNAPAGNPHPFGQALYYSGVTLATLGYGDIQPLRLPLRAVAVIEGITGAATVALGVAYVLSVYPALARQRTIATALDAEVAGQPGAVPMLRRYAPSRIAWQEDLPRHLRVLALDLLEMTGSHENHPVLYYSHPMRVQHSFLRIIITVQNLLGLVRYGLSPDRHADLVQHPDVLLLEHALHYSLRRLTTSMHIAPILEADDDEQCLAEDFERLCGDLEQIGLVSARMAASQPVPVLVEVGDAPMRGGDPALDQSSDTPLAAYTAFRRETDPLIAAYAHTSGYSVDTARAAFKANWWADGR